MSFSLLLHVKIETFVTVIDALYHLIVTTIGTGILGYPYAASYLGFAGGKQCKKREAMFDFPYSVLMRRALRCALLLLILLLLLLSFYIQAAIFIIVFSAYCYYTALLLVGLQESDYGTYSEIADGVMGKSKGGFSKYTVVPAQYMYFFPMVATMIIVGGTAMSTMDTLANNGKETLSLKLWMVVDAIFVFAFSMTKDLSSAWQISIVGSLAAFLIVGYSVAGSIVALTDPSEMESVEYARPASETKGLEYQVHLMAAFGEIMFGYGFHAVLPDIQASLHSGSAEESRSHMKKAVTGAMTFSATSYLIVAMMGYAAFGVSVNSLLLLDFNDLLPDAAMYTVWVFVAIKTSTEGAVFNQAAFSLTRDLLGMTQEDDQGRRSIDHHPKNWILDFVMKLVWVALATVVAIYLPYFGDLTSITSAISIT